MEKLCTLLMLLCALQLSAQEKRETERGVKSKEVSKEAVDWLRNSYEGFRKVQWFFQQDGEERSFEAKLKWAGHWHSVAFDTAGVVRDVEIAVPWESLTDTLRQALSVYFDGNYRKWSIEKLQLQWLGHPDDLEDLIDEQESEGLTLNLEVEYRGQTETEDVLWEGLFDASGRLLQKRKIILGNLNNLSY